MNKKVMLISLLYVICIVFLLIIDIYNLLSFITLKMNFEYLSIAIDTITAIYLFWVAYYLINKKISDSEFERKINKQNSLYVMLYETYDECNKSIELFKNEEILIKYIVPKVDFHNTMDPFIERQKSFVFKYDDKILDFVSDGVVEKNILKEYINIKQLFSQYINMKIAFYDINSPKYNNNEDAKETRFEINKIEKKIKLNVKKALTLTKSKI